ncbi:MAG: hypothetical protein HOB84_12030 [Candidatus Marinimicrobia bacterium]|jgi:hypothetical protein|nr:hypothetical protein [Candidatus Neomarinimicrobiota bacterium]MBT5315049.1 hypothetical protein [Candidatus Neomarinimicrobiota bacterium]
MQKFKFILILFIALSVESQESRTAMKKPEVYTIANLEYTIGKDQQYLNKLTYVVKIEATEIVGIDSSKYSKMTIPQKESLWLKILKNVYQSTSRFSPCFLILHGYINGNEAAIVPFDELEHIYKAKTVYLIEEESVFRKINYYKDMYSPLLGEELPEPEFNPFGK